MRIGVIGTGAMGNNHLRVLHSIPQCRITCAVDVNRDNLDKACQGLDITKLMDYRQAPAHVDAVMVSTPTKEHFDICRFFLENGKHVLVEKPISKTLDEADRLIAISDKNRLVLAVGHLERFNPAVEYIGHLVEKPRFIEIQRLGSFSPRSLDIDVILDLMIHDLDIILQLDRSGIREIRSSGIPVISQKIDIASVRLEFNSGLIANLTASRISQDKTRKLRIFQKDLYMSVDYKERSVKMIQLQNGQIRENIPQIPNIEPLYNLWQNFFKTITSGNNCNVTGRDGRAALQLALDISAAIVPVLDA
jgi:predicted dehydrogenase